MSEPTVERARPLEALHRAARALDAVVCLVSTSDSVDRETGRRWRSRACGSRLYMLAVVQPHHARDLSRRQRLVRGQLIARVDVHPAVTLDDCATVALEQLAPLLQRRQTA